MPYMVMVDVRGQEIEHLNELGQHYLTDGCDVAVMQHQSRAQERPIVSVYHHGNPLHMPCVS